MLKVGDEVDVYVLSRQPAGEEDRPLDQAHAARAVEPGGDASTRSGRWCPATITQLANFGAFARIEDGIEGLIHVSELSDERVNHPREVVQEGQEVQVRIIRIDAAAAAHGAQPARAPMRAAAALWGCLMTAARRRKARAAGAERPTAHRWKSAADAGRAG